MATRPDAAASCFERAGMLLEAGRAYERAGRAFYSFNSPGDFGPGANEHACKNALTFFAEKLAQAHIPRSFATLSLEHGYGDPPRRLLKIRTRWVRQF